MTHRAGSAASLGLALAVAVATIAAACAETRRPVRFPHRAHLGELVCGAPGKPACLSCASCHAPSEQAMLPLPAADALCGSCHHDEPALVKAVLRVEQPRPYGKIAFDHDRHLAMPEVNGQCVPCHGGVVEAGAAAMPPMSQCFGCHEHEAEWNRGQCAPCHQDHDLRGLLPVTFLRHDAGFARRHGMQAQHEGELCQACHTQAQCDDCHDLSQELDVERRRPEALERSFVHRADFVARHSIEARSEPARCARCHTPETCEGCHLERGVSANRLDALSPHPPGWIGASAGSRSQHGREARRDILACAGCHDQGPATNCIRCHKVGAYGGNPHPGGTWTSAGGLTQTMCRYCHE